MWNIYSRGGGKPLDAFDEGAGILLQAGGGREGGGDWSRIAGCRKKKADFVFSYAIRKGGEEIVCGGLQGEWNALSKTICTREGRGRKKPLFARRGGAFESIQIQRF